MSDPVHTVPMPISLLLTISALEYYISYRYWSWLLVSADYFNWSVNETFNNVEGGNPDIIQKIQR
jgi:hypothetical protein